MPPVYMGIDRVCNALGQDVKNLGELQIHIK